MVATPSALTDPAAFAAAYLDSLTLGAGQFCTNPGLLLVPRGCGFADTAASQIQSTTGGPLVNEGIRDQLAQRMGRVLSLERAEVIAAGTASGEGFTAAPSLISVPLETAFGDPHGVSTECFGPVGVVIEYDSLSRQSVWCDAFQAVSSGRSTPPKATK